MNPRTNFLLLALLAIFLSQLSASAQVQQAWVARYNGASNADDYATALALDSAGNAYVTGASLAGPPSEPVPSYFTIKYLPDGTSAWTSQYRGPSASFNLPLAIAVDSAGNAHVTGYTGSGSYAYYDTIKYGPNGAQVWEARYSRSGGFNRATGIVLDSGGNVIVSGSAYDDITDGYSLTTVKYSPSGVQSWVAHCCGGLYQGPSAPVVDTAGNVYITGGQILPGTAGSGIAIVKYGPSGNQLWNVVYHQTSESANSVAVDSGGNVYVAGITLDVDEFSMASLILKYRSNGTLIWATRFHSSTAGDDPSGRLILDSGGNVYLVSTSARASTGKDYVTTKLDPNGRQLWATRYNGPGNGDDFASSIVLDSSANIYVTGYSVGVNRTNNDYATVKYDSAGNQLWVARYNGPGDGNDYANSIALDPAGNVYVTGNSMGATTAMDYATVKYTQSQVAGLPRITGAPQSQIVLQGTNIAFLVDATGDAPLNYQWRWNGLAITNATNATLTLTNTQFTHEGDYSVAVSNAAGFTVSPEARLSVHSPPVILTQPASQTVFVEQPASFSLMATGRPPPAYQWRRNGAKLSGATNITLSFTSVSSNNGGAYTVVVTNAAGSVTSAVATLTVLVQAPIITNQPMSQIAFVGDFVLLDVGYSAHPEPSFQWRRNGADIPGQLGYQLGFFPTTDDTGNYTVVVSNYAGSATSAVAVLTVLMPPPQITTQPASQTAFTGDNVTFSVTAQGPLPLFYQWRWNGQPLAGRTNRVLSLPSVNTNQAGDYSVVVNHSQGSVTSAVAALSVYLPAPVIVTQPQSQVVDLGRRALFSVFATGRPPLVYQWRFNGSNLLGETGSALLFPAVSNRLAGGYSVIISNAAGYVSSAVAILTVATYNPLDHWHWRNPLPQGNDLKSAAYGSGSWVAVGDYGTIVASSNGSPWMAQSSGTSNNLNGVTYGNGLFVAVGNRGALLTSSNAVSWVPVPSETAFGINSVAFANGNFIAVGESGTVLVSSNGVSWTSRYARTNLNLSGVTFGAGAYVVVSEPIYPSAVGFIFSFASPAQEVWNWTQTPVSNRLHAVAWGNGAFVAIGEQDVSNSAPNILTSTNGVSWTSQSTAGTLRSVAFDHSTFVAVGDAILTSSDGRSWTERVSPSSLDYRLLYGVAAGGGMFVRVGLAGEMAVSADGVDWLSQSAGTTKSLSLIAHGNGTFVALGEEGAHLTSPDGVTWTSHSSGLANGGFGSALAFLNGLFVKGGGEMATSNDGVNWTNRGPGGSVESIAYGNGTFVAVGPGAAPNAPPTILTSPDGLSWTRQPGPSVWILRSVAFGHGTFVAVGENSRVVLSVNGEVWAIAPEAFGWTSVTYGNGLFVACTYGSARSNIATSADGLNWTAQDSGVAANLWNVLYADGVFIAVGATGIYPAENVLVTSTDGVNWTRRNLPLARPIDGIYSGKIGYGNATFVVVGRNGAILQSDPILPHLTSGRGAAGVGFELTISGGLTRRYELQASIELPATEWTDLLTFTNTIPRTNFMDANAANFPRRFYRLVSP